MPASAPAVAATGDGEGPAPPPTRRTGLDQTLAPVRCVEELFHWNEKEELGSGFFAVVYKAVRKADGEVFAVKCVKKARMENSAQWQQLAHEVIICKHLTHPGCVKCYDAFQDEHTVYLVLEWVPGGNLVNAIMTRKAEFTEAVVAVFARQILDTLVYLHNEMGIVHRDLKPENILLTTRDLYTAHLKFTDFGCAKFVGHHQDSSLQIEKTMGLSPTSPGIQHTLQTSLHPGSHAVSPALGTVLSSPQGSVRYAAPEIIDHLYKNGCKPCTHPEITKVDMYAAGVVVYVQLCATFPYKGDKVEDIKRNMDTTTPPFPMHLSHLAKEFCQWLMEKDPQRRPLALQALRHDWVTAPPPAALPTTSPQLQRLQLQNTELHHKLAQASGKDQEQEDVVVRLQEDLAALRAEGAAS